LAEPEMRGHANEDFLEAEIGELPEKEMACLVQDYFLSSLRGVAVEKGNLCWRRDNCDYKSKEGIRLRRLIRRKETRATARSAKV
jgi:hypothetical protein